MSVIKIENDAFGLDTGAGFETVDTKEKLSTGIEEDVKPLSELDRIPDIASMQDETLHSSDLKAREEDEAIYKRDISCAGSADNQVEDMKLSIQKDGLENASDLSTETCCKADIIKEKPSCCNDAVKPFRLYRIQNTTSLIPKDGKNNNYGSAKTGSFYEVVEGNEISNGEYLTTSHAKRVAEWILVSPDKRKSTLSQPDQIKKESPDLDEPSTGLDPMAVQSSLDEVVSGNDNLENNIGGRPDAGEAMSTPSQKNQIKKEPLDLDEPSTSLDPKVVYSNDDADVVSGNNDLENNNVGKPLSNDSIDSNFPLPETETKARGDNSRIYTNYFPDAGESSLDSERQVMMKDYCKDIAVEHVNQQSGQDLGTDGMALDQGMKSGDKGLNDFSRSHLCDKTFFTAQVLPRHLKGFHTHEHHRKKSFNHSNPQSYTSTHKGEKLCKFVQTLTLSKNLQCSLKLHIGESLLKKQQQQQQQQQNFSRRSHLQSHSRKAEKPFKCNHCHKSYSDRGYLNRHMRTHSGEKPFKCDQCDKSFSERFYLQSHMNTHTREKPFKCYQCHKNFGRISDFQRHMKTHKEEKQFKCDQCDKRFREKNTFLRHTRMHTGEKPFKCDYCDKMFSETTYLRSHLRTHTGEKPFKCSQCFKNFSNSSYLHRHMKTHTGDKPFKCDQCDKSFSERFYLQSHMNTHTREKPFKCYQCHKNFGRICDLQRHMKTHKEEKQFKCDLCDKRFREKSTFLRHTRMHTGEKPFKCDYCDKMFSETTYLRSHLRTHTGEKPFKCSQCSKNFSNTSYLHRHMKTHTGDKPFKCDQCHKNFTFSCDLKRHMKTHTRDQPFKCDHCHEKFSFTSALKRHMKTHTREKPFKCDQCHKNFSNSRCLHRHMKTHRPTGEKPFKLDTSAKAS